MPSLVKRLGKLNQYGIIYMNTHGGVSTLSGWSHTTWISTGEKVTKQGLKGWWNEMVRAGRDIRPGIGIATLEGDHYFMVNQRFINNYKYPDSLIYIDACRSFEYDSLANAFLNNGAAAYFGWTEDTWEWSEGFMSQVTSAIFGQLIQPNITMFEAYRAPVIGIKGRSYSVQDLYPVTIYKDDEGDHRTPICYSGPDKDESYDDIWDTAPIDPKRTYELNCQYKLRSDIQNFILNPASNQAPEPRILAPPDNANFTEGATIVFQGEAIDPEDGTLTGSSLFWTSSLYGEIGSGESFTRSDLSVGTHTITLTATDSQWAKEEDSITISIERVSSAYDLVWSPRTPMPTPRAYASAVVHQNQIYVVGGVSCTSNCQQFYNAVGTLEAYDPQTDTWEQLPPMPTPRVGPLVAALNGKIYVMGGFNRENGTDFELFTRRVVEIYNIATRTWIRGPDMLKPRAWGKAVVLNGEIYVLGGCGDYTYSPGYHGGCEVYDPSANSWSNCASFNPGRYLQAAITYNSKIYMIGGDSWESGSDEVYSDIQVYDPFTDRWDVRTPMSTAASSLDAVVVDNKIWVFGSGGLCRVYNIAADRWEEKSSTQDPAGAFSVAYLNGIVYRFGGGNWGPTLDIVEAATISP
jgi:hypothetical protein